MSPRKKQKKKITGKIQLFNMEELDKKLAKRLLGKEGEARGVTLATDANFVKENFDEKELGKVEEKIKEVGGSLAYREIRPTAFYPIGLRAVSLLAVRDTFNLSEKQIEEMGREAPRNSWLIKLFARFFLSVAEIASQADKIWEKHYTAGKLEIETLKEEEREIIIRLKELDLHPVFCVYLKGYFSAILEMTIDSPVEAERVKCPLEDKRVKWHEYKVTWQKNKKKTR